MGLTVSHGDTARPGIEGEAGELEACVATGALAVRRAVAQSYAQSSRYLCLGRLLDELVKGQAPAQEVP